MPPRGGMEACIFMPKDTPLANIEESRIAGAAGDPGGRPDQRRGRHGRRKGRAEGWFDVSTFKEPYRVEGKKIMGYELAEDFGWELPDVIIYPTGGGTGLVGMWKAFAEMEAMGWLENPQRPRMVAVQAEGCAPVIKAFEKGTAFCDFWMGAQTLASGLASAQELCRPGDLARISARARAHAVAVSDEAILAASSSWPPQKASLPPPKAPPPWPPSLS